MTKARTTHLEERMDYCCVSLYADGNCEVDGACQSYLGHGQHHRDQVGVTSNLPYAEIGMVLVEYGPIECDYSGYNVGNAKSMMDMRMQRRSKIARQSMRWWKDFWANFCEKVMMHMRLPTQPSAPNMTLTLISTGGPNHLPQPSAVHCGPIWLPIDPKMVSKFKLGHSVHVKMIFGVEHFFGAPLAAP